MLRGGFVVNSRYIGSVLSFHEPVAPFSGDACKLFAGCSQLMSLF